MSSETGAIGELFVRAALGAPENSVGFILWRVVHFYQREVDRALAGLGLTHLQFETLTMTAWLQRTSAVVPQAALARFSDIHPVQLSQVLKVLEGKGLATRDRDSLDERAKTLQVTPAGIALLAKALPIVVDVQLRMFGEDGRPGGDLLVALLRAEERQQAAIDGSTPETGAAASQ